MVRQSQKKHKLFDLYALLRCTMTPEDVTELLRRYPGFSDRTVHDFDRDIQTAIEAMTEAMLAVQPADLANAEPLRGV